MLSLSLLSIVFPAAVAAVVSCNAQAIYVLSNQAKNAVVAIQIHSNGSLIHTSVTETGGAGAAGLVVSSAGTNTPAGPDTLFSQSSLTVAGKHLFAVNPGSNSLSMFKIHSPTNLTLMDKVNIPGEFPVTVAASGKHKQVCVGTTGAKAGISCTSFSQAGLKEMDALRPFDLGQTTPPVGPFNTVSQVFFGGNTLFSTVKGDPTKNNTGFLAEFEIKNGAVETCGRQTSPPGTAVLFGSAVIDPSRLFVTDASFGAAELTLGANDIRVSKGVIQGQKATCWATINPSTQTAFVTDVATNRLIEMSLNATLLNTINLNNGDPGLIDLQGAGDFIYALSPGNGTTQSAISVVNVHSKKQVQHLTLGGVLDKNAQGMAILR